MPINYAHVRSNAKLNLQEALRPALSSAEVVKMGYLKVDNISRGTIGRKARGIGKAVRRNPVMRGAATTVGVAGATVAVGTLVVGTAGAATPFIVAAGSLTTRLGLVAIDRAATKAKEPEAAKTHWAKHAEYQQKWSENVKKFDDAVGAARAWSDIAAALEHLAEALHYAAKRNEVAAALIASFCNLLSINPMNLASYNTKIAREEQDVIDHVKRLLANMDPTRPGG